MSAFNYDELKRHIGHKIVCVAYGNCKDPVNVAIECETCDEVLFDYDKELSDPKDEDPICLKCGSNVRHDVFACSTCGTSLDYKPEKGDHYDSHSQS